MRLLRNRNLWLALAIAGAVCASLCAQSTAIEKQAALGRTLAAQMETQFPPLTDPLISGYVRQLANKIAVHAALSYPVVAKVNLDPQVRVVPLPAGHLFITSTTILRTQSEGELAALMAHAIGHMIVSRPKVVPRVDLATVPLLIWMGQPCMRVGGVPTQIDAYRFYQPDAQTTEEEADLLASGYLIAAGYSASDLIAAFNGFPSAVIPLSLSPELKHVAGTVVTTSQYQQMKERLAVLVQGPVVRHTRPTLYR